MPGYHVKAESSKHSECSPAQSTQSSRSESKCIFLGDEWHHGEAFHECQWNVLRVALFSAFPWRIWTLGAQDRMEACP